MTELLRRLRFTLLGADEWTVLKVVKDARVLDAKSRYVVACLPSRVGVILADADRRAGRGRRRTAGRIVAVRWRGGEEGGGGARLGSAPHRRSWLLP
jgi:hypothetical protein